MVFFGPDVVLGVAAGLGVTEILGVAAGLGVVVFFGAGVGLGVMVFFGVTKEIKFLIEGKSVDIVFTDNKEGLLDCALVTTGTAGAFKTTGLTSLEFSDKFDQLKKELIISNIENPNTSLKNFTKIMISNKTHATNSMIAIK